MEQTKRLVPALSSKWARPNEFDSWKFIQAKGFELLTYDMVKERKEPLPKFDSPDGLIRRLYFTEPEFPRTMRVLEVLYPEFQQDLHEADIMENELGYLRRSKDEQTGRYTWEWKKLLSNDVKDPARGGPMSGV